MSMTHAGCGVSRPPNRPGAMLWWESCRRMPVGNPALNWEARWEDASLFIEHCAPPYGTVRDGALEIELGERVGSVILRRSLRTKSTILR
eukprot:2030900-Prymnesium_polylepis.1